MIADMNDDLTQPLPADFPVVVLMQRQPSVHRQWSDYQWQAVGVMAMADEHMSDEEKQLVRSEGELMQVLYSGFTIRLYVDECESYYFNLISPNPRCYVIARNNEDAVPVPFLVTMSFDDAHSYMEADEEVYAVDISPELYRWTEAFVLQHYSHEKRKKRKRDDWKDKQKTGLPG